MMNDRIAYPYGKSHREAAHVVRDKARIASAHEKDSHDEREKSRKAFNALAEFYMGYWGR